MKRVALSLALLVVFGAALAQTRQDAVNVHIVVASGGSAYNAISPRAAEISAKNRNVTFVYVRPDDFQHFLRTVTPIDIVVCDSPEQLSGNSAFQQAAEKGANVCGGAGDCTAFVAPNVRGDRKAAVQQVFQTITQR